jgi:ABC-2 type transport system ATP-binding protein
MPAAREIAAAERLSKRFGDVVALRDVTFTLEGPQIIGILGPNGAGKTTLLEILEGLSRPTGGSVRLFGAPLGAGPYPRRRVGVVMQREFALDKITVEEYAKLFAAIQGVKGGKEAILTSAGLEGRARVGVDRLSGGEAQRLFIAASVVHDPALLFLDEPTAHLDPESKSRIGGLLRAMAAARTVIVTTHDLREADAVCDHVLFLVDGQVKASGPRQALIDAVPDDSRRGRGIEDAFFHFCAARITAQGNLE